MPRPRTTKYDTVLMKNPYKINLKVERDMDV